MRTILLVAMTIVVLSGHAQDTVRLRLSDAVASAVKNNREVKLAELEKENAIAKFGQTNAVFLPSVNLSYSAVTTVNPLNSFGFKLQQQSVSVADFNPALLNNPPATQNYTTRIEWSQPLFNLDMLWQRNAADQQIDVYHYKVERSKEFVTFEVTKTFAQLQLAQEAVFIMEKTLSTVNSIYENVANHFEQGLLQKSDLLLTQVHVATAQSRLAEAITNLQNVSGYMNLLTGDQNGTVYFVELLQKVDCPGELKTQTPENRADLMALKSALKAHESMLKSARMSPMPRLNAFGNYMFNDQSAFGFGSKSYLIGAQLSWSLFNGTATYHKTAEQKIARDRIKEQLAYQKEQSQLELDKAYRQLHNARFAIQQHESSVRHAEEAFRIQLDRFDVGLISINDLLQTHTTLSEQKLRLSESVCNFNSTVAHIQFLATQN